ncbi:hypothetical protein CFSAN002367_02604 [Clostridium botulinum CFSAN002367]|nr:hypothetical protein CFSAN002367_02604 [Clostridium botulinum CFSAN002367]
MHGNAEEEAKAVFEKLKKLTKCYFCYAWRMYKPCFRCS